MNYFCNLLYFSKL